MKKLLATLVVCLFAAGFVSAAESPMFAKVVKVASVTSHQKGFRVRYYTAHGDLSTVYIPIEWFYNSGKDYRTSDGFIRAEAVRGSGPSYPYMQIFWKDGEFHHVRLFLVKDFGDMSWEVVHVGEDISANFDPQKMPDFKF